MELEIGIAIGFLGWLILVKSFFFTVAQNQRAVKTVFGRAQRHGNSTTLDDPISQSLKDYEKERYTFPQVKVIMPGGPYLKWPWEQVYKVSIATETANMAWDPQFPEANHNGTMLDAVTKDQLNTGLTGQIRYQASERNLYAYLFGVANPVAHVMGYFVSVLRERIATFSAPVSEEKSSEEDAPKKESIQNSQKNIVAEGISINDLRKNLRDLNEHMDYECQCSEARYGIRLDASLITGIDPPHEVESALAAINTAHNEVSSNLSLANARADQRIVESRRAVEIETLKAEAEVEPLKKLAAQLVELKNRGGKAALDAYVRTTRLPLLKKADRIINEVKS